MDSKYFEEQYPLDTRKEELDAMVRFIFSGRSAQVIGVPGVGKSNVVRLLPYNKKIRELHLGEKESSYHFVYMDFSEVRGRSLSDVLKFILISVAFSLGERGLVSEQKAVNTYLKEALGLADDFILSQALKKSIDFLTKEKDLSVVFLFDRFEEYVSNVNSQFFLNLRLLRNRAKYMFSCVFALNRPLEDVLEPQIIAEFYEWIVGNCVCLPLFDRVGLEFRLDYLEKITKKKASSDIRQNIIKLSGGHGKLTRVSYEAFLAEDKKPNKEDALEHFLLENKQVRGSLFEIWNYLLPEEKQDLRQKKPNEFLEKVYLLKGEKCQVPLFAEFIKNAPSSRNLKITYEPTRNELKKGEENLTEKLSPSEFRLLRVLVLEEGRVFEKDEIINAVWKDTKSQEGVSDQALDQIIYRLRKKIEEDPNSPHFIQTVKGRGYKFNN